MGQVPPGAIATQDGELAAVLGAGWFGRVRQFQLTSSVQPNARAPPTATGNDTVRLTSMDTLLLITHFVAAVGGGFIGWSMFARRAAE